MDKSVQSNQQTRRNSKGGSPVVTSTRKLVEGKELAKKSESPDP
jgi:hypothetical protein